MPPRCRSTNRPFRSGCRCGRHPPRTGSSGGLRGRRRRFLSGTGDPPGSAGRPSRCALSGGGCPPGACGGPFCRRTRRCRRFFRSCVMFVMVFSGRRIFLAGIYARGRGRS